MALMVLLKGVNVGGQRVFRPTVLAEQLKHLDAISIGAAGTFVIRRSVSQTRLRAEIAQRLPFDAVITICQGSEIVRLISRNPFAGVPAPPGVVRFMSVLSQHPQSTPAIPTRFPASGEWLLRVLGRESRFVFGLYRCHMKFFHEDRWTRGRVATGLNSVRVPEFREIARLG